MNENINLCEILKGHEGETFYSPIFGNVKLEYVLQCNTPIPIITKVIDSSYTVCFTKEGKHRTSIFNSDMLLFPSKDQYDWHKWIEERNKIFKTWNDIILNKTTFEYKLYYPAVDDENYFTYVGTNPIEESAIALLKIHQLIGIGYGGNLTNKEWITQNTKYLITPICNKNSYKFIVTTTTFFTDKCHIAFHTKEQAEEFLKYEENIQLLRNYFMIQNYE